MLNLLLFTVISVIPVSLSQISLLEMPEHKRKRLMALSSNVMRDESDKVNHCVTEAGFRYINQLLYFLSCNLPSLKMNCSY